MGPASGEGWAHWVLLFWGQNSAWRIPLEGKVLQNAGRECEAEKLGGLGVPCSSGSVLLFRNCPCSGQAVPDPFPSEAEISPTLLQLTALA